MVPDCQKKRFTLKFRFNNNNNNKRKEKKRKGLCFDVISDAIRFLFSSLLSISSWLTHINIVVCSMFNIPCNIPSLNFYQ